MDLELHSFVGRVVRDPIRRNWDASNSNEKLVLFNVAVNRRFKKQDGTTDSRVTYYPCSAWGRTAEIVDQYAKKGKEVGIQADFRNNSRRNEDGTWSNFMTFRVNRVSLGRDSGKTQSISESVGSESVPGAGVSEETLIQQINNMQAQIAVLTK